MKKILISTLVILLIAGCVLYLVKNFKFSENSLFKMRPNTATALFQVTPRETIPFTPGETFEFIYNLGPVNVGKATLTFSGAADIHGKSAYLVTFESRVGAFYDLENIYADPASFYPLYVVRKIKNLGISTQIKEIYDQDGFSVEISKKEFLGSRSETIKKKGRINNALLLIYHCRQLLKAGLEQGYEFDVILPVGEMKVALRGIKDINVPAGNFKAYLFESMPEKMRLWISADGKYIPLKMENLGSVGPSSIVLKKEDF
ncbi:MAG: DUF3108 domain-containing protein [Candidatus Omnitrophica bacterium]|nr:DUF3108 domain-containing protein [Candidatus Omnitrophota bacterium]